ncbi:MAG: InlB B-repeat-containing protein [Atopobiaceae bacterium]|nr:InlB B-repeat-containing protein [Atopobiaceae bacterium]
MEEAPEASVAEDSIADEALDETESAAEAEAVVVEEPELLVVQDETDSAAQTEPVVVEEPELLAAQDDGEVVRVKTADELIQFAQRGPQNGTVVLDANITLTERFYVQAGRTVTLNLNNHKLSRTVKHAGDLSSTLPSDGSVITVERGATLKITDSILAGGTITGGWSSRGGGISNYGKLEINGGTITGCTAEVGGAIFNNGTLDVINCYLQDNTALSKGGAIANDVDGTIRVEGGRIEKNKATGEREAWGATGHGGGIFNQGTATISEVPIHENSAAYGAGVSSLTDTSAGNNVAKLTLSNCDVASNKASEHGGGIFASSGVEGGSSEEPPTDPSVTLINTRVHDNSARRFGGAIYNPSWNCTVRITDSTVTDNSAPSYAGIYCLSVLQMSGAPVVRDNPSTGKASNISLGAPHNTIHVVGKMTAGAHVEWKVPDKEPISFITKDYAKYNSDDPAKYFFIDNNSSSTYTHGHTVCLSTQQQEAMVSANIPYLDEKGTNQFCHDYKVISSNDDKNLREGWYLIDNDLTLSERFVVQTGHARIILRNGVTANTKGITVEENKTLSIYGQTKTGGKLTANAPNNSAGIGSNKDTMPGTINICGGTIVATGGQFAAGIGGGYNYNHAGLSYNPNDPRIVPRGLIHIYQGNVTATGGEFASGIGGGQRNSNPKIIIDDGTIVATGTYQAAGIGAGGNAGVYQPIIINGGNVTATGHAGAGIGAGHEARPTAYPSIYAEIILRGGHIKAASYSGTNTRQYFSRGAGIGGGSYEYTHSINTFTNNGCIVCCGATIEASGSASSTSPLGPGAYNTSNQLLIRLNYDSRYPDASADYMVLDMNGKKVLAANRVAQCRDSDYARLVPCDHEDFEHVGGENGTSKLACKYCGRQDIAHIITFEPGEGTGKAFEKYVLSERNLTLPGTDAFQSPGEGKVLVGWKAGDTVYQPGEPVRFDADTTLVAQWALTWASLQDWIDRSEKGDTIHLSQDVVATASDTTLVVPAGKFVVIDTCGYDINRNVNKACEDGTVLRVEGDLRIRDEDQASHSNSVITGGKTTGNGGGVVVANGGKLRIYGDVTVTGNSAQGVGGGVYVATLGDFDLRGGIVSDNSAPSGGGICVAGLGVCTLASGKVTSNVATDGDGGGILVDGGTLTINTIGPISANKATGQGGGVMVRAGRASQWSTTISDNSADVNGGGVAIAEGASYIMHTPSKIKDNSSYKFGGGVYVAPGGRFSIYSEASITGNKTESTAMGKDVYLGTDALIEVMEPLNENDVISVYVQKRPTASNPTTITTGLANKGGAINFTTDASAYATGINADGEAILGTKATVKFSAGAGTGSMDSVTMASGSTYTLPACKFTEPVGQVFKDWMVAGESEGRAAGSSLLVQKNVTLTAQWTPTINLWVDGTQVTSGNTADILGDGTASFDPVTHVLTLKGFKANHGDHMGCKIHAQGFDLTVEGTGTVISDSYAIRVDDGDLTLRGDLTIYTRVDPSRAVVARNHVVTIDGGRVRIGGGPAGNSTFGYGVTASTLAVGKDVERFELHGEIMWSTDCSVQIADNLYIQTPEGGYIGKGSSNRDILYDAQGNEANHLVVVPRPWSPSFTTYSLTLEGTIGVNFFTDLSGLSEEERQACYVDFSVAGKGGFTQRVPYDAKFTNESGDYYGFTCHVNSIQMADTITATLHYGDDQTVETTNSVETYVEGFEKRKGEYDDRMIALVEAMADYGHYAQPFLSSERGWTIGTDYARMGTHFEEGFDHSAIVAAAKRHERTVSGVTSDIAHISYLLRLDTTTTLAVYFQLARGYDGPVTARLDGQEVEAQDLGGGRLRIACEGISAHQLADRHTFEIQTAAGTARVEASTLSYVYTIVSNTLQSTAAKDAMSALYRYWAAANAYLGG